VIVVMKLISMCVKVWVE